MTQPSARASESRAAALHRQGGSWRLVVLGSAGSAVRLLESRTLPAGDVASVRSVLEHHDVPRLIRVLPASSAVCRVVEAPEGDPGEVASALSLIGEATLPAHLPAHRRAAAPLAGINGTIGSRAALVVGWSGPADDPPIGGIEESWTAEPAALLWLIRLRCRAALIADRATGSVSVFAAGAQRMIVRGFKESNASDAEWNRAVDGYFEQSAAGAGLSTAFRRLSVDGVDLRVDASATELFASLAPECGSDRWAAEYGVAAGAALGALLGPIAMKPLHSLTAEATRRDESRAARVLRAMASADRAPWIMAAALITALLGPLLLQTARHSILNAKSGGLAAQQDSDRREALVGEFHSLLESRRWPMIRLLADLSGLLPVGITSESIRLETGQRISLRGRAESLDHVNRFQSRLNASGVFAEASIDRTQAAKDGGGVEFDLSCRVVRPYSNAVGVEDFSKETLAQRLYGADSGESAAGEPTAADSRSGSASPAGSTEAPRATSRERSTSRPAAKPAEIPEPLTDEAIALLDASAAMKQWTSRQKASKQAGIDAATRDRLKAEAEKCRARMQAARKESSS
ncbi:MAG: PilN domain-containing protein [Phycisphaerae bacterium]|nr:PilN domain-containing protein [Phycisphaerae bacterium]